MRVTRVLVVGVAFLLTLSTAGFSQQPASPSEPFIAGDLLGTQLIAWSEMQRPQPVPQPKPDPAPLPDPQPEQQPDRPAPPADAQQAPPAQPASPAAQRTLTGTIVKDQGHYVLRSSDNTIYQLDDQQRVKPFEGKQVRVVGRLGDALLFHVERIELM